MDRSGIYQYYTDNKGLNATFSIQLGTDPGDPNYAADKLKDGNPARPAKIDSPTGAWMADLGTAYAIENTMLIHHTFDEGVLCLIQASDVPNNWGSPLFEAQITIPAWYGVGTGRWPVNPWLDLTEEPGWDAGGWQFWRLYVESNSQNLQLGQWLLHTPTRRLSNDLAWGFKKTTLKRQIENRTSFGVVTIYARGTNEVTIEGDHRMELVLANDVDLQFFNTEGRARSWGFVPDGSKNESFFGRWATQSREVTRQEAHFEHHFVFEETSRGLRFGV